MAKYRLSRRAVQDLSDIWDYTYETWSEEQADKYYTLLLDSCQEIAKNPERGKAYEIVTPNLLGYKSNQHIIFYRRLSANEIGIVRVLHGMMDLKSKI